MKMNKKLIPYVLMASLTVGGLGAVKLPFADLLKKDTVGFDVRDISRRLGDAEERYSISKQEAAKVWAIVGDKGQGVETDDGKPAQGAFVAELKDAVQKHIAEIDGLEEAVTKAISAALAKSKNAPALKEDFLARIAAESKQGPWMKKLLEARRVAWDDRETAFKVGEAAIAVCAVTALIASGKYSAVGSGLWNTGAWLLNRPGALLGWFGYEVSKIAPEAVVTPVKSNLGTGILSRNVSNR